MRSLRELAVVRTGDKGALVTVAVLARNPVDYPLLARALPASVVAARLAPVLTGPVRRHELPLLGALLFSCAGVRGGGVSSSTELDAHGKTYGHLLLDIELEER
ncbi:hypothetical protein EV191_106143 [Tamaricihabitans halophyticus]|uniref:AtuA-like ferredoxin-fold domain-containing protein n=1 Tax=Tamaricihabitans halophyticus TaxID=1262583 RepID=A0A4R2QSP1_9PSEU|nr:hypothetical protein [Tamaricihabitans halophyticus]TCP51979.1 hypothetical protein EV191_106143 [Tamaricihabitans halophyticus]